jgi:hypothetical protein
MTRLADTGATPTHKAADHLHPGITLTRKPGLPTSGCGITRTEQA